MHVLITGGGGFIGVGDPYLFTTLAAVVIGGTSLAGGYGGYGFTDDCPVSRLYRGARYGTLGGGTTETLKELLGEKIMKDFPPDGFLSMGGF